MNTEQREHLLQELFQHATESILVTDERGAIRLINPATERLFGYTQEELEMKPVEVLLPRSLAARHEGHRESFNRNPHSRAMGIGMDLYAKRKDDTEFPVEISLSPFRSDGQQFIIAFIIDITRRKKVEVEIANHQKKLEQMTVELRQSNERLEAKVQDRTKVLQEAFNEIEKSREELSIALEKEKELNELKSRFLSMASHEFRTPLTTILSSASLIPQYPDMSQQDRRIRHVERIKSAVSHLNDILGDFLSLSKIEEGRVQAEYQEFDLEDLTRQTLDEMKPIVLGSQQIRYEHKGLKQVVLDPKLVRNILVNLISNAIKFSAEDSRIFIETEVDGDHIRLQVKDEGIGISAEDQDHLFERFFRGQNVTNIQGTGLGLNIVAGYVQLMDGEIQLESELDKGSTFFITFQKKSM